MTDGNALSVTPMPTGAGMILPAPRCEGALSVRLATLADIPFIDSLQKMHQKMLGWTPRKTIEGKIAAGHILIADCQLSIANLNSSQSEIGNRQSAIPVGYCISQDRYMGRDDCGVIYQLNVAPVEQRKLIGATLVKTIFERAAYGCRLFCCWCAQDIDANYFWESIGFVPLAFRAGNRAKARVHIFWQRRIREGDTTAPYWFPAETRGGMMNEARLVLPIPPGTSWKDAKPIVLPGGEVPRAARPCLPGKSKKKDTGGPPVAPRKKALAGPPPPGKVAIVVGGKIRYIDRPSAGHTPVVSAPPPAPPASAPKPKREPRPKAKNDPKHVAAARELRDRWMEEINAGRYLPVSNGKYEVSRALHLAATLASPLQLPAA